MTTHRLPHSAPRTSRSPMAMAAFYCSPIPPPPPPPPPVVAAERHHRLAAEPRARLLLPWAAPERRRSSLSAPESPASPPLSLCRLGVRSVVLEQGESLRAGGTSLTLFKNGWRVLDSIGVADDLRSQFLEIQGLVMRTGDGRKLRSFAFKDDAPEQEVRAVERRVLLETLANRLPSNTITFSSRLKSIRQEGSGGSILELENGGCINAKIVIGCDGIRSPIANWMGFSEPKYVGHCAFRGLGEYPGGHPHEAKVNYIYGRGIRAGFVPISPTKVYWFICFNSTSPGPKNTDPYLLKKEALNLVRIWPAELLDVIQNTPDDVIIKTPLVDRWLWPGLTPSASKNGVVVVGDAWHPMTPNLGQGACCAVNMERANFSE